MFTETCVDSAPRLKDKIFFVMLMQYLIAFSE